MGVADLSTRDLNALLETAVKGLDVEASGVVAGPDREKAWAAIKRDVAKAKDEGRTLWPVAE